MALVSRCVAVLIVLINHCGVCDRCRQCLVKAQKKPGVAAGAPERAGKWCGSYGATKLPSTVTLLKSLTPTTRMYQVPAVGVLITTDSELPGFTDL